MARCRNSSPLGKKPECGTKVVSHLPTSTRRVPKRGSKKASRSWAPKIGSTQYTRARMQERIADEQRLWNAIPRVRDLQCAWQLLLQNAGPRANHTIQTFPPESSHQYALEHDAGMWRTALALLGEIPGTASEVRDAEQMATLSMRMGGLGLRSTGRCATAACWASWADALPMINQRNSSVADMVVARLSGDGAHDGCLAELHEAAGRLEREGFWWKPSWSYLQGRARPTQAVEGNLGSGNTGQYWSSSVSDAHFRETTMLAGRTAARRAHLRSHSGRNALHWRSAQQHQSSPFSHICSGRFCSNDSSCHSRSRKQSAKVARLPWTR